MSFKESGMNIKDYISSNNPGNQYVKYNNIYINDKNNSQQQSEFQKLYEERQEEEQQNKIASLTKQEKLKYNAKCLQICGENESCNGLNIDEDNECGIINKITNNNKITKSEDNTSYVKKDLVKDYNNSDEYLLKLGHHKYITSEDEYGQTLLKATNHKKDASKFKFNNNNSIINTDTNKCVQSNGSYLILSDCDANNKSQNFIIENKLNTLRNDSNNCLTRYSESDKVTLTECDNSLTKNNSQIVHTKKSKDKENYDTQQKNIDLDYDDDEDDYSSSICENNTYKIVMNVVFAVIIFLLLYYIINSNGETEKIE